MGLKAFKTNIEAEEKGVWRKLDDMEFLVSRLGTKASQKAFKTYREDVYGTGPKGRARAQTGGKENEVLALVVANTCVHGWKGNIDFDFSREKCVELLTDPEYRPLLEEIIAFAMDDQAYYEQQVKDDEEMAGKSPSGSTSTEETRSAGKK